MKKLMSLVLSILMLLSVLPMTASAETAESWSLVTYAQNGPEFSVTANNFTGEGSYTFVATATKADESTIVKEATATLSGGTLSATVNFEEGGIEADVSIKSVETVVVNSSDETVIEAKTFAVTPQTVDGDVYSSLTNGFYEPVTDTYSTSKYYVWRTANTSSYPCGYEGIQSYTFSPANAIYDNNPTTAGSAAANIAASNYKGHYVNELSTATAIDRIVAYYGHTGNTENDVKFYLSNVAPSWSTDATTKDSLYLANFTGADTTDVDYLGYRGDSDSYAAGEEAHDGYKLVFDASGDAYKYIVAAYEFATTGGYVKELQAYKKVVAEQTVAPNLGDIDVTYIQSGPAFSVSASGFVTDAESLIFVATATKADDSTIVKQTAATLNNGNLSATVNFEEGGIEADVSIKSVETVVKNAGTGDVVVEAQTFTVAPQTVTDNVYNNLTNGFYEPVTNTYSTSKYYVWRTANTSSYPCGYEGIQSYTFSPANAIYDNDPTTAGSAAANIAASNYKGHYANELSTATAIDRVVAYYGHTGTVENDVKFYLSNVAPSWSTDATTKDSLYLANFTGADTTDVDYLGYRGDSSSYVAGEEAHDGYRIVFDASGAAYKYVVAAYEFETTGGYVKELQAYKKVTDSKTVSYINTGDNSGTGGTPGDGEGSGGITPPEPPAVIPDGAVNVAQNVAAFAYGSQAGTSPALAVDGNSATAWVSANDSDYRDYLILDLGTKYKIDGLVLTMAEGSDQNFTVYGMNTSFNSSRNSAVTQNVSATEFARTALTAPQNSLTDGENVIANILSTEKFRYIVFEQTASDGNDPAFGFAEIEVYTLDAVGASSDSVSKTKSSVAAITRHNANNDGDNLIASKGNLITDASPVTAAGPVDLGYKWNNNVSHTVMIDLGKAQTVSHVAYQGVSTGASYPYQCKYFMIVGANSLPADERYTVVDNSYNITGLQNVDVLARFDGGTNTAITEDSTYHETGLLVFEVPEAYKNNKYQYIGIVKIDPTDDAGQVMRTNIGTLQAYTTTDNLSDLVEEEGGRRIIDVETPAITDDAITYSASFWNGESDGSLLGIFTQYDESGNALQTVYADGGMLLAGAYQTVNMTVPVTDGTIGRWELVILSDLKIYDYISDLENKTRPAAYTGTLSGTATMKQTGYNISATGSVGAGMIGMLILKPGATAADFDAADVYAHVFAKAPANQAEVWNYSLQYAMPQNAPGTPGVDTYTACLISDTGALTDTLTINLFDVASVVTAFQSATAASAADLVDANSAFFGTDVATDVASATDFGESFMLAKEGITSGIFNAGLTNWNDINVITAAIQAALVVDASYADADVKETVAKYGSAMPAVFDNADYDADDFEEILPEVMDSLAPDTASELVDAYERTIALALIANGTLENKVKALTDYSDALGISAETLNTSYENLSIAEKLSNSMDTVKNTYAGGMDTAVSNAISELDGGQGEGGTTLGSSPSIGGGGGGGIVATNKDTDPEKPAVIAPQPEKTDSLISQLTGFTDIDNHAWAHDAIKLMKERNIINGVTENSFAPDALLTREQTAKLLVLTLNLETTMEDNGYRDCTYSSWYYPFISSAKAHGLVSGISRVEFGLGQNITRQDLAVMIYRAMQSKKLVDASQTKAFSDDSAVSDYAKEAVAALGATGIITGFEDGSFEPGQPATRAQAAVIFARFLNLIETASEEG